MEFCSVPSDASEDILKGYDRDFICVLFSGPISATAIAQSNYFGSGGRKDPLAMLHNLTLTNVPSVACSSVRVSSK